MILRKRLNLEQFQRSTTLLFKIFIIGMVWQFLAHTFLTFGLHLPSQLSFIWIWKELIIIIVLIRLSYLISTNQEVRTKILHNKWMQRIGGITILSILISVATTLFIHDQNIISFIVSAKFNYTPLIVFIVGFWASLLLTKEQNMSIIKTTITTIKRVLIFSLFRYGILNTIPNVLDRIWYAQPWTSIERIIGTPPPSLWLTEFYSGFIRNQWPFSWPLSLWFYLTILWPLFFAFVLYKKKFSDTRWRWLLYLTMVLTTYSRAAQGMFIIISVLLALIIYRKYSKYILLWVGSLITLLTIYLLKWGWSWIFLRTRSDQGHVQFFLEWLYLVQKHRQRWIGASSVWPWANYGGSWVDVFNPENQYMQIWLEYGLLWVISRLSAYFVIFLRPFKLRLKTWTNKFTKSVSETTLAFIWIAAALVGLAIAGMVLHPFVDSSSIYPFLLSSWILFSLISNDTSINILRNNHIESQKKISWQLWEWISWDDKKNSSKRITNLLISRTVLVGVFFVLQNYLVYGGELFSNTVILSSLRDAIFWSIVVVSVLWRWKQLRKFCSHYRFIIIPILAVILINGAYLIQHTSNLLASIAGIKYDIFQFLIIGSGLWYGYLMVSNKQGTKVLYYLKWFLKFSLILIIWWLVWQISKNIFPILFTEYLWYSSPSDFIPYSKPPIYYITWAWWLERLSGFFVGPNTLGFFLILMTSVLYYSIKKKLTSQRLLWSIVGYLIIVALTLSRAAIIWVGLQIILLLVIESIHREKFNRRTTVRWIRWKQLLYMLITAIYMVSALSIIGLRKQWSNSERRQSHSSINNLLTKQVPLLWYGPWYVWPAQHYELGYLSHQKNDYALVENIYLQTFINQWWLWMILFVGIIFGIAYIHLSLLKNSSRQLSITNQEIKMITQYLGLGFLGLLSIGWFLHIFIDSMVNYLFLLPYSISLWYCFWMISIKPILNSNLSTRKE